ncbi:hypothetical protein [Brumimicrobium sp.]|uniref:hypothetical protein n=1 Tax=Brumimicrobium sp. TaxID=2029867 RepID=UPI003A91BD75
MKKHNGMRPHDIVILLKIAAKENKPWLMKELSHELGISASEVSESLSRSAFAGLITQNKKTLMRLSILEFLVHGLKYVYPQKPGSILRGIPTAHSASPLSKEIISNESFVWSYGEGTIRGQSIEPLHPKVPEACLKDPLFYEFMALCDTLRVGKAREVNMAKEELKNRLL